jgi:extracellular factor (EF) 3-hydroxypalmitic acid methyl ester biosynthesis protein
MNLRVTEGSEFVGTAAWPLDAADDLVATLQAIDRQARREQRTLPTKEERRRGLTAFWAMVDALESFEATAPAPTVAEVGTALRALVSPWLLRSRYWNRSYVKPHGYAGDFRVLEWMYDLEGDPCEDATQPAVINVLDAVYASVHSVRAVWHRRRWFADLVCRERRQSDTVRVLDVACGGSRYLRDVITDPQRCTDVEGVFVDQDPAAVAFVNSWLPDSTHTTVCAPARRLLDTARDMRLGPFDVVLSTGLFDYLPRAEAASLLGDMTALTRPAGVTAICNFRPTDASRLVKEWISDWRLIYRSEHELAALFPEPEAVVLDASPDGGLIYASARRAG